MSLGGKHDPASRLFSGFDKGSKKHRRIINRIGAVRLLTQGSDRGCLTLIGLRCLEFREFRLAVNNRACRVFRDDFPDKLAFFIRAVNLGCGESRTSGNY